MFGTVGNTQGYVRVTLVDGSSLTGLYAADGSINIVELTAPSAPVGLYHACGALNAVAVDGTSPCGLYHPSGALNVITGAVPGSIYHPSGALQVNQNVGNVAAALVNTWSSTGDGFAAVFEGDTPAIYVKDSGTPANDKSITNNSLTDFSSFFTYTTPTPKITRQADGYWKYQAHNLYVNSASPANQAITVVPGANYTVVITGSVSVTASGAATGAWTAGTNTFTAATTTLTLGSTSGSGTVHVRLTAAVDTYIETGASAVYAPPIHHNTDGTAYGLRMERAATNLISDEYNRTAAPVFSTGGSATTARTQTGITGVANSAWLLTTTTTNDVTSHGITTITADAFYFSSIVIKRTSGDNFVCLEARYVIVAAGYVQCWFDLVNGTKGTSNVVAGTTTAVLDDYDIEDLGDDFYRIWFKAKTTTGTQMTARLYSATSDGSLTAAGGTYINEMWQLEAAGTDGLAKPTSPIRTFGSSRTRTADIFGKVGNLPFSTTANSIYFKWDYQQVANYNQPFAALNADNSDRIEVFPNSGTQAGRVREATVEVYSAGLGAASTTPNQKIAVSTELDSHDAALNGTSATADTSGATPNGLDRIWFGSRGADNSAHLTGGYIKELLIVPEKWPASTNESITS